MNGMETVNVYDIDLKEMLEEFGNSSASVYWLKQFYVVVMVEDMEILLMMMEWEIHEVVAVIS